MTDAAIGNAFRNCEDFVRRQLRCGTYILYVYSIDGLVSGDAISDFVLRPVSHQLRGESMEELYRNALEGQIYNSVATPCKDLEDVKRKLVNGFAVLLFPGVGAIAFEAKTGEKRGISPPEVETSVKGAKDAFTETLRTNTSLLRRHLRTPNLRLQGTTVGTESLTYTVVAWIEGHTDPKLVDRMQDRLAQIQTDGLLFPGGVEQLVTHSRATPFPLLQYTERADKFAQGLLSGRVGLLVDGLPLGYLAPVDLGYFMSSPEDRGVDPMSARFIRILRYGALLLSLLLTGFYTALTVFHQEMIPLPLLRSIIEARASVPFSVAGEVIGLLLAFELLQEAGLHLPKSIGQSVSIIGGIVVGSAAVEASLISPSALIVVSLAGICGFALPNRDLAEGLRLCRLGLTLLAAKAGLFGLTVGAIALVIHLSGITSLGEPYLAPFSGEAKP